MIGYKVSPYIKKLLKWSILSLIICLFFCFSVGFADDEDIPSVQDPTDRTNELLQTIADKLSETPSDGTIEILPYENTELQQLRVSPSDTSGLHAVFLSLIGDYNPVVKDYTYTSSQGYTSHSIEITPDWSWIMTAALFILVLYCFFRLLGMALGGK